MIMDNQKNKSAFDYYTNLDSHPMTGVFKTDFDVVVVVKPWTEGFFNGAENYNQVTEVTPGKTYHVSKVECLGDVSDFCVIGDNGKEKRLASFFFEPAP